MKTDKFEESIRKKLEGIDPPFRETHWVHLRSVLRRNGVPSIGSTALPWAVPMLSAASVAGLLILTVWQYRTNQQLEKTVATLKDSVTILQQAPVTAAPKPDTVYITRELEGPRLIPVTPDSRSENRGTDEQTGLSALDSAEPALPGRPADPESTPWQKPDNRVFPERSGTPERLTESTRENRLNETESSVAGRERTERNAESSQTGQMTGSKATGERWNRRDDQRYSGRQKPDGFEAARPVSGANRLPDQTALSGNFGARTESAGPQSLSWGPVMSRQLLNRALAFDSSYYVENYQRRIRRIRPLYTPAAPASPVAKPQQSDIEEPAPMLRFRLGAGGEIAGNQSGFGIAGELLIGKHLVASVGLSRLKLQGDEFFSDFQYFQKRNSDFRNDFPGKVPADPKIEVYNISQKAQTWQLPITLGYRLPIGNDVTVLPSAGLSFSMSTLEKITFTRRRGPTVLDGFYEAGFERKCEPSLYNSWLMSLGVEKKAGNWALQLMPYLSNPVKQSRNSLNQTTAGFRARIMYEF
ncbi:hypothetical protein ACFPMF_21870 [Larkinella bovis]|uniref:Outer membrane protein beta-barrel domain-containing protein n=1 Tax=Larkinella bovis TaxID=683041 RepID=A0ABW0III5_9BACT